MKVMLDPGARMPTKAHGSDAGWDLYTPVNMTVHPCKLVENASIIQGDPFMENQVSLGSATIDTGVHIQIPEGYFGKIESKSGLNVNFGIVCLGGVIDSGYTGSIVVKLYNTTNEPYYFKAGDKIAQIIIQPCVAPELELVDSLDETERGDNGFGSSGR